MITCIIHVGVCVRCYGPIQTRAADMVAATSFLRFNYGSNCVEKDYFTLN